MCGRDDGGIPPPSSRIRIERKSGEGDIVTWIGGRISVVDDEEVEEKRGL